MDQISAVIFAETFAVWDCGASHSTAGQQRLDLVLSFSEVVILLLSPQMKPAREPAERVFSKQAVVQPLVLKLQLQNSSLLRYPLPDVYTV